MSQEQINILLALLVPCMPVITILIQQFLARRKNKIDYGDDLLDVTNKMAASLKEARAELSSLEQELRTSEQQHADEIGVLEKQWKERQNLLRGRIRDLERTIIKYDISFTLTTHPTVQITDLKVVGKEDVMASQKIRAIKDGDIPK
jgi:hypothetical protein